MELCPEKLITIAALIAVEIAKGKTIEEIKTYKNLFSLISNNLHEYCNQLIFIKSNNENKKSK